MRFKGGELSWENSRNKKHPSAPFKKLNETFEARSVIMSQPLSRALNALANTQIDPTPMQQRLNFSAANGNQTNKSIDLKLTLMQQDLGPLEGPNVAWPALRQAERWWRGEGGRGAVRKQTQRFRWVTKNPCTGHSPDHSPHFLRFREPCAPASPDKIQMQTPEAKDQQCASSSLQKKEKKRVFRLNCCNSASTLTAVPVCSGCSAAPHIRHACVCVWVLGKKGGKSRHWASEVRPSRGNNQ